MIVLVIWLNGLSAEFETHPSWGSCIREMDRRDDASCHLIEPKKGTTQ